MNDIKTQIQSTLNAFSNGNLLDNAKSLLNVLGYESERTFQLSPNNYKGFSELFRAGPSNFDPEKAKVKDWQSIDIIFQLAEDDIKKSRSLFEAKKVDNTIIESYLFFAVALTGEKYTRGDLVRITREINKLTPMPAIVLFRYGKYLTISVIDRRPNKKDPSKDVMTKKISLIKDINIERPHHAHVIILSKFGLAELIEKHKAINTLDDLYKAFRSTLDIAALNRDFYRQISAWYYYATSNIKLPIRPEYYKDDKDNVKNFTVRLICRMIFCWFLKEKGLIDPKLLEVYDYADNPILMVKKTKKDFDKENSYYRGILQNIFLSCLNSPMDSKKRRQEYLGKKYLADDFDSSLLDNIPFLNGGLFDRLEEDNYNETIEDGPLYVPNELFYGKNLTIGTGKKTLRTEGLNRILASYVFTVDESTPLEEELALDPELLGLVFENLLAEIDPDEDVAKTARKESGSFYTPRKVIDYMVNESLLLYLSNYFKQKGKDELIKSLNDLIYFDRLDNDNKPFKAAVVDGLDSIKVLDPACGSGAFPMGMLHRIVSILKLVDSNNHLWLEKQLSRIEDKFQRDNFAKILEQHLEDYPRKLGIIKNVVYGLDNQPLAVLITKLRFFITLLIEQQIDLKKPQENYHITPLPNIETKIICADSLVDLDIGLFDESTFAHLRNAKEKYYRPNLTRDEKEQIASEISEILATYFPNFSERVTGKKLKDPKSENLRNKVILKQWFQHANLCAPFFNFDLFYPELIHQPFDIVIGNPPYGGKNIHENVRAKLHLGSNDPYGAFIARFMGDGFRSTPLTNKGILAYIVSDTFMTIKSHLQLRKQLMHNYIHKIIRVNSDTFKATVNTAIIICQRNVYPSGTTVDQAKIDATHNCQMVDMSNISIHDDYEKFLKILYETEGFEKRNSVNTEEYAIYYYPQSLIYLNAHVPFFVASPKLFMVMQNLNTNIVDKQVGDKKATDARVRQISINGKTIEVVRFGDLASSPHGISTGNNKRYVRSLPNTRGGYDLIEDCMLMPPNEIKALSRIDKIKGVNKDWETMRGCFVPFEKGGESETDDGWLPNYYVPTRYFINWAKGAIEDMRQNPGFAWKNERYFFRDGLTFSISGVYAPTFRLNSGGVFEAKGSGIFSEAFSSELMLGILCSKMSKFIFKNYIKHTVDTSGDDIAEFVFPIKASNNIRHLVAQIISKQKKDAKYPYASNEQLEIDHLVYEAYGLNDEDIAEVENWYARRYPKLVKAQNNKLAAEASS